MSEFVELHNTITDSAINTEINYLGVFQSFDLKEELTNTLTNKEGSASDTTISPAKIISNKTQDDSKALEEAYNRGVEDGRKQRQENLVAEYDKNLTSLKEKCEKINISLSRQFSRMSSSLEANAVRLAIAIAYKIVKREVLSDGTIVMQQIKEALHRVWGVDMVKLRVNPIDAQLVQEQRTTLLTNSEFIRELLIETDENIEQGGCIIESSAGNVDARLTTQLKQIEAALLSQTSSEKESQ